MKKYHYYSFAFSHANRNSSSQTTASVYIGYKYKGISTPQIKYAKEAAKISTEAVMLSCCYLGKMSADEMAQGITSRFTLTGKAVAFWNKFKYLVGFSGR